MTLKTWTRRGSIAEPNCREGRRIAGESKFLFSGQAVSCTRVALAANRDARPSGCQRSGIWRALVRGRGA
jgi:hypothetical protein